MHEKTPFEFSKDDYVEAAIGHWHDTPNKAKGFLANPCAYGVAININNQLVGGIWGAGYATYAAPPVLFAALRMVRMFGDAKMLIVHMLPEARKYFGQMSANKHGRKTDDFAVAIRELTETERGRHTIRLYPATPGTSKGPLFKAATQLARGAAKEAAMKHRADNDPTTTKYPWPCIVQEDQVYGNLA